MKFKSVYFRMRRRIKALMDASPTVYLTFCRLRSRTRALVVAKDTDIVIEGYPRSANTFAVAAQGRLVKIARHLHAPAHVISGVNMGIPTLALIRQPEQAVLSLLVRAPHITPKQALKDYIRFYKTILPFRGSYVLANFEEVTRDFGKIIQRINACFGTNFKIFEHTEENLKEVFKTVEKMDKQDTGLPEVKEETVARPSPERERLKALMQEKLKETGVQELLQEAKELYQMLAFGENEGYSTERNR